MADQMGSGKTRSHGRRGHRAVIAATLLVFLASDANAAFDRAQAGEAGMVGASVLGSLVYTPLKLAYAGAGSIVGGFAWVFSGADPNVSKPIFDRALGGDYYLTPSHLRQPRNIAFVGDAEPTYAVERALPAVSATPSACDIATTPAVYFASGSVALGSESRATLDSARETMRACPTLRFEIAGYTDTTGSPTANRALAEQRAESVRAFLLDGGIEADRLSLFPYGEAIQGNATEEGRARNRRVELVAR